MQAIDFLTNWITYLVIVIPVGAGAMITYQATRKSFTDDEEIISDCNTKIANTLKGAIIGLTISGFIAIVKSFYV